MGACFSCIDAAAAPLYAGSGSGSQTTRAALSSRPDLLAARLCDVAVASSHNTYVHTLQVGGAASAAAISAAVAAGARCIELDVFRDAAGGVCVAHGQEREPSDLLVTTRLPIDDALAAAATADVGGDPLFVALELNVHGDAAACDVLAAALRRHFGGRLFAAPLTPQTPLRDLLGKVVILSGSGAAGAALPPLVAAQWGTAFPNVDSDANPVAAAAAATCARVYPAGNLEGALSLNYDAAPFLAAGATFVALNLGMPDAHCEAYLARFRDCSFLRKAVTGA